MRPMFKYVRGRKTDKADARWLAKLMRFGLLQASFIPPAGQRDLRDLTRYRTKLVQERSREVNRVQGVLERANIKLASVATDIMGVSARAIVEALIAGGADPATIVTLAQGRMRTKIPALEQALTGMVWPHHRRLLAIQLAHIDFLDEQIETLGTEVTACLTALSLASGALTAAERPPDVERPGVEAEATPRLLYPGHHPARYYSRGESTRRGNVGRRMGCRHAALWDGRPLSGLEWRGPEQQ